MLGLIEPRAISVRVGAHLVLAALPLLAITAHVAGVAPMHLSAGLLIVPATILLACLAVFAPTAEDRLISAGLRWGIVATAVYDLVRLDTVALLGWWADFIPTMGTWLLGLEPDQLVLGGVAGYVWRYAGDGGGLGVVFVVLTAATGLRHLGQRVVVLAAVGFAVGPTWGGLIATVALTGRGQQMLFPLTPTTVALSLLGHVVFGLVLGFGIARSRVDLEGHWTRPRLIDLPALDPAAVRPLPVPARSARLTPAALTPAAPVPAAPIPAALAPVALPAARTRLSPTTGVRAPAAAELTIELPPMAASPRSPAGPAFAPARSGSATAGFAACYPRTALGDSGPVPVAVPAAGPGVDRHEPPGPPAGLTEDLGQPVPDSPAPLFASSSAPALLSSTHRPEPTSGRRGLRGVVIGTVGAALALPLMSTWVSPATPPGVKALSSYAAVTGIAAMVLAVVTLARSRRLSRAAGWPALLHWHRLLGYGALAAVAVHIGVTVAHSPKGLGLLNPLGASSPILAGILATAALLVAAVAFVRPLARVLPHRVRRALHVLAAAGVGIAAGLHVLWMHVPDTAAGLLWTLTLTAGLAALLAARWLWRPGRARPMLIHTSRRESTGLFTLRLVPASGADHGLRFAPGQFVWLRRSRLPRPAGEHPFTISSSAREHRFVELTVAETGPFTRRLAALAPGTPVYLDGPHGSFTPDDRAAPGGLVLIAGGSGLAPMLAILRTLADTGDHRRHRLVVSAPGRPYGGELDALATLLRLEVTWLEGRWIDPALLRDVLADDLPNDRPEGVGPARGGSGGPAGGLGDAGLDRLGFFVCGPGAVISGALAALDRLDVLAAAIATERY